MLTLGAYLFVSKKSHLARGGDVVHSKFQTFTNGYIGLLVPTVWQLDFGDRAQIIAGVLVSNECLI